MASNVADNLVVGKVLKVTRKTYEVAVDGRIINCMVKGSLTARNSEYRTVRVGDDVKVQLIREAEGVITEILPRRSRLSRTLESRQYQEHIIATNVDQILVIMAAREPTFKSGLMDRYLVIAEKNNLQAKICINKIDLVDKRNFDVYQKYYTKIGYETFFTSVVTGEGLDQLKKVLKDNVTALVGHSGVGKSSLIKALEPGLDIKVGEVSRRTGKGQHTTTVVQLFPLSFGGFVVDTPGIRELGFWDIYKKDLHHYFKEFRQYEADCQFADCLHIHEPGCAVKAAVETGEILEERYHNYLAIYASLKNAPYEKR